MSDSSNPVNNESVINSSESSESNVKRSKINKFNSNGSTNHVDVRIVKTVKSLQSQKESSIMNSPRNNRTGSTNNSSNTNKSQHLPKSGGLKAEEKELIEEEKKNATFSKLYYNNILIMYCASFNIYVNSN